MMVVVSDTLLWNISFVKTLIYIAVVHNIHAKLRWILYTTV